MLQQSTQATTHATNSPTVPAKKERLLGLDFFRFFGAFIVIAGHYSGWISLYGKPFTLPETYLGYYFSSELLSAIVWLPVPIFLMIGGFNNLGRKISPDDSPKKIYRGALKILKIYTFWTIVMTTLSAILGKITFAELPLKIVSYFFAPGGGTQFTGHFWYLAFYIGCLVVAPVYRAFFTTANIKLIRTFMIVAIIGGYVMPQLTIITYTFMADVDWYVAIFQNTSFFDLARMYYGIFLMFLIAGWFKVDPMYEKILKKTNVWVLFGLFIAGFMAYFIQYYVTQPEWFIYNPETPNLVPNYDALLFLPANIIGFSLFKKLDYIIKADSKFAQFINKHSGRMLTVYILGLPVQSQILSDFTRELALGAPSGFAYTLIVLGLSAIVFAFCWVLTIVLEKIPFVKKFT
jgi:hypothetical protein